MAIVTAMDGADPRTRLAALIDASGASYAALSRMLRRNDAYLQQYVRRGTPRDLAERDRALLATYFGVDAAELGGIAAPRLAPVRRLDLAASAGPGTLPGDDPTVEPVLFDPRLLDTLRLSPANAAMLHARGDSMLPTIADGDQIMVDERDTRVGTTPEIFVLRLDGTLLVKRISTDRGRYVVASDNPAYPPIATDAVEVIGRVVWLSRALR